MDDQIIAEQDSGDPRWINQNILQNEMMEQQMGIQPGQETDQQPVANDNDTDADPEHDAQMKKMQDAQAQYDLLSNKKNRSLSDEAKLKSVSQILAKNK